MFIKNFIKYLFLFLNIYPILIYSQNDNRWVYVAEVDYKSGTTSYYYDNKTIVNNDETIIIWVKAELHNTKSYVANDLVRVLDKWEINCKNKTIEYLAETNYYKDGTIYNLPFENIYTKLDIVPESLGEQFYNILCHFTTD